MLTNYSDKLCEVAINLMQNGMAVVECMQKFNKPKTRSQIFDPR